MSELRHKNTKVYREEQKIRRKIGWWHLDYIRAHGHKYSTKRANTHISLRQNKNGKEIPTSIAFRHDVHENEESTRKNSYFCWMFFNIVKVFFSAFFPIFDLKLCINNYSTWCACIVLQDSAHFNISARLFALQLIYSTSIETSMRHGRSSVFFFFIISAAHVYVKCSLWQSAYTIKAYSINNR